MTDSPPASNRRAIWSWAFYDWANSAFATTVLAGFFPVFYGNYWREGSGPGVSTAELGFANTAASVAVALMAPALGAIADAGGQRRGFLFLFTAIGVLATGVLAFLGQPAWMVALAAFMVACVGFNGALVFYDAMLVDVAEESAWDRVSSLGFGLGYLGGGLLFTVNVAMLLKFEAFGFAGKADAIRASFLTVSIWWALFSVPLFLFVRSRKASGAMSLGAAARKGLGEIASTIRELPRYRPIFLFIVAYMLYIDGVNTVIRMATKFGADLNFEPSVLMTALLMTQFIAFPAALAFGWLSGRIGPRPAIIVGLAVYTVATFGAMFMTKPAHFYLLAGLVGLVQGGVQSLSRSFFARLIPPEKAGEFFGLYNMLGKAAAIIGPTLMAITALMVSDSRYHIASLPILFIVGGVLLLRVPNQRVEVA
ncbi:MFS transporter [bacterium]|nr:MFS transporter [bacterium]